MRPWRVAAVGDSITHGWGLPANQSYPAQLQRMLAASSAVPPGSLVVNFGRDHASISTDCAASSAQPRARHQPCRPYSSTEEYTRALASTPTHVVVLLGTNDILFGDTHHVPGVLLGAGSFAWKRRKDTGWSDADVLRGATDADRIKGAGSLVRTFLQLASQPRVLVSPAPPMARPGASERLAGLSSLWSTIARRHNLSQPVRLDLAFGKHAGCDQRTLNKSYPDAHGATIRPSGCALLQLDGIHPTAEGAGAIAQAVLHALTHRYRSMGG